MAGFFSTAKIEQIKPQKSGIPQCGICGCNKSCRNKLGVYGEGKKDILVILDYPTEQEDRKGRFLLSGERGSFLRNTFDELGIDIMEDCYITYALLCKPSRTDNIKDKCLSSCSPNILKLIEDKKPKVIIPIGTEASKSVIDNSWKEGSGSVNRWQGMIIPDQKYNAFICPNFDCKSLLSDRPHQVQLQYFRDNLSKAFSKNSYPYNTIIDYKKQVKIIYNTNKAVKYINRFNKSKYIAFDYETNGLIPEIEGFKIYSCSLSNGDLTIAYLWNEKTMQATFDLLKNKEVKKIAANIKYEDRVSNFFGCKVANWYWDTMLSAHVIDNRPGITGLKFLSYAFFGMENYDSHIKPYLQSGHGKLNSIHKLDTETLLLYNGLDSLLEYKLAMVQKEILCH